MTKVQLTLKSVRARPVVVPLNRPVVSKVGLFRDWPLILIDLYTNEGVVGHSYLEPYLKQSARYIVPVLQDLAEAAKGQPVAPFDAYRRGIGSLRAKTRRTLFQHWLLLALRRGRQSTAADKRCGTPMFTRTSP
jgi:hypothetical protein